MARTVPAPPTTDGAVVQVSASSSMELLATVFAFCAPDEHRPSYDVGTSWFRRAARTGGPVATRIRDFAGGSLLFWDHVMGAAMDLGAADGLGVDDLLDRLASVDPIGLRMTLLGGHNRPVLRTVPEGLIAEAAAGSSDAAARYRRLTSRSDTTWQAAIGYLLSQDPATVRGELVELIAGWRATVYEPWEQMTAPHLAERAVSDRETVATAPDPLVAASELLAGRPLHLEGVRRVQLITSTIVRPFVYYLEHRDTLTYLYPQDMAAWPAMKKPDDDGGELEIGAHGRLLATANALADEMRLQLLHVVRDGDHTMRDLTERTGWPRSTVRHHLTILVDAGLVQALTDRSRVTTYRMRDAAIPDLADLLRAYLRRD